MIFQITEFNYWSQSDIWHVRHLTSIILPPTNDLTNQNRRKWFLQWTGWYLTLTTGRLDISRTHGDFSDPIKQGTSKMTLSYFSSSNVIEATAFQHPGKCWITEHCAFEYHIWRCIATVRTPAQATVPNDLNLSSIASRGVFVDRIWHCS